MRIETTTAQFPVTYERPEQSRTVRKASIEIRNDGNEEFGQFVVMVSAEKFTGAVWVDTFATFEFYDMAKAVECAREHATYFRTNAR